MVDYFRINLNKEGDRAGGTRAKIIMGSISAAWLIAAGIIWFITYECNSDLDKRIQNRRDAITDFENKINALTADQAQDQVSESDVRTLVNIWKNRLLWSKKLADIPDLVSKDMILSNIHYNGRYLTLTGYTKIVDDQKEFQLVADFIEQIKRTPSFTDDFEDVIFKSQSKHNVQGKELLSFEIQCILK